MCITERTSSSPARVRPDGRPQKHNDARVASALSVLRRFDSSARVESVVKTADTTIIRLAPGNFSSASTHLAAVAALRVAFPFSAVSVNENMVTGDTQIQMLLTTNEIAVKHAKEFFAETRPFKLLNQFSNLLLGASAFSFVVLLQASL
jgi:hypothetical protein